MQATTAPHRARLALYSWLIGALATSACSELPIDECYPCTSECPSGYTCHNGFCTPRDEPDACGHAEGGAGGEPSSDTALDSSAASSTGSLGGISTGQGGSAVDGGSGGSGSGSSASPASIATGSDDNSTGSGGALAGSTEGVGANSGAGTAGGAGANPDDTTTTGNGGACTSDACTPEIVTPRHLPGACEGEEVRIQLEARCACDGETAFRDLSWQPVSAPNLTLSNDGLLTGLPEPGTHEFVVTVLIDDSVSVAGTFQLDIWDNCHAFFVASADAATSQVVAVRLDNGEDTPLPRVLGEGASVLAFDVSPDGTFLAQAEALEDLTKLQLFLVSTDGITPLPIEHSGNYITHEFSRDSDWLAILSTNPEVEQERLLEVVDLAADPVKLAGSDSIEHTAGLAWSDAGGVLYTAPSPFSPIFDAVYERSVGTEGIGSEIAYPETEAYMNPLTQFLASDDGFFAVRAAQAYYYDRQEGVRQLVFPDAVSPALGWMAVEEGEGMRIDPVDRVALPELPYSLAKDCDFIGAWSADDSTFVCMSTWAPVAYAAGEGDLEGSALPLPAHPDAPTPRMALSEHGTWFAFVPDDDGLALLRRQDFPKGLDSAARLGTPDGTNEWDFFFTKDESKLIVQRGRELRVAQLGATASEFEAVGVTLPSVPDCISSWESDYQRWCGAPRFAGNLVISKHETHLAFVDNDDVAHVVNLATLTPTELGQVAESCTHDCVQLR
ncbi:MAG TPA: hypothetical protein VFU02_12175 [Polyangiaceae bacterium]|nr:hypothetical protein [Polyangiaceae bacterium]